MGISKKHQFLEVSLHFGNGDFSPRTVEAKPSTSWLNIVLNLLYLFVFV